MFCEACIKHNISFTVKSLLFESSDIVCVCVCVSYPQMHLQTSQQDYVC